MKRAYWTLIGMVIFIGFGIAACAPTTEIQPAGPTPIPADTPIPLPAAEVVFQFQAPGGTPADAQISLELLDILTGRDINTIRIPMTKTDDGDWETILTPPVGSILYYRYHRNTPSDAFEATQQEPIRYRVGFVSGPITFDDTAASWSDQTYEDTTGRIVGRIFDQESGEGLTDVLVSVAGVQTFTDSDGRFRVDALSPGLHRMTAVGMDGSYQTASQGAMVAEDQTTPVELGMKPATPVLATFELVVPSDTIPGTPVRIAGSLQQLGNRFSPLSGGGQLLVTQMPEMVMVDDTHYLAVLQLYAGSELRYKYTYGDGLWNAERDSTGALFSRSIIVPDEDFSVKDTVATWHPPGEGSISFLVDVPENTPASDRVSVQLKSTYWFEPIPMWNLGGGEWFYILYGPTNFAQDLSYRYCRNQGCGSADDSETSGPDATGRPLKTSQGLQNQVDRVVEWQWLESDPGETTVVAADAEAIPDFETGIELQPIWTPEWSDSLLIALDSIVDMGANRIIFAPTWSAVDDQTVPRLDLNPNRTPFADEFNAWANQAKMRGLEFCVRPSFRPESGSLDDYWLNADRDRTWWSVWFEEYQSLLLYYAEQAERNGAECLIISGSEVEPSFPEGILKDGTTSTPPYDSQDRWFNLIEEVRSRYSGMIALELAMGETLQALPPFFEEFEQVYIRWRPPLAQSEQSSIVEMQETASAILDDALSLRSLRDKKIILSVEIPSVTGGANACPPAPDGSCRDPVEFESGADVDPDLQVNLTAQANAINAVFLAISSRDDLQGMAVRGFNPMAELRDKSTSVYGKPAQDVIWYWYRVLTGVDDP